MSIEILPKHEPSTATGSTLDLLNPVDVRRAARKLKEQDPNPIIRAWLDSARSGLQSRAGRKRKHVRSALSRAVRQLKAASFDELLGAFSDEDHMGDLYDHIDKERAIDISGVEVAAKSVTYSVRGSSKTRKVGFKRLREIYKETQT